MKNRVSVLRNHLRTARGPLAAGIIGLALAVALCPAVAAPLLAHDAAAQAAGRRSADLRELSPLGPWREVAPGVWKASAGDMSREVRYTDWAASPPRAEALARRSGRAFPFDTGSVSYERTADGKIMVRLPCRADEKLYGFGLQLKRLEASRSVLTLNVDHWSTGGGRTHAPVPFYISSRGYGVFVNTARFLKVYVQVGNRKDEPGRPKAADRNPPQGEEAGTWDAQPRADAVEVLVDGPGVEIIVFAGADPADVVSRYNLFCGGGALPPLWGLGFWHRVPATADADRVRREVAAFEAHGIPLDVVGLEPGWMSRSYPCTFEWQPKRFPDPAGLAAELLRKGVRLNLWENPYVSPESRLYPTLYPLSGSHLVWLGLVPDYTLPEARRALLEQHARDHFAVGVSGYKIDEVDGFDVWLWPDHASFPSGTPAPVMRQIYGLIMQNVIFTGLFRPRNVRTYGLARASNGAASGYPFAVYSDAYDLKEYVKGVSAASLGGVLWTPEIRSAGGERDWLERMRLVCFSALAQLNAWASETTPWQFPGVTDRVRETIRLRLRLLPYLYSAFANYHFEGLPPLRAMLLEDPALAGAEDQFFFGPSILVAPFTDPAAKDRTVRLPAGRWYDFETGEFAVDGGEIRVSVDTGRFPLFVREGAVVPMLKEPAANAVQAYGRDLEVRWYGRAAGAFELYEDDGKTFDYESGKYRVRRLAVTMDGQGRPKLEEIILKDGAPPMFGRASLRIMTR